MCECVNTAVHKAERMERGTIKFHAQVSHTLNCTNVRLGIFFGGFSLIVCQRDNEKEKKPSGLSFSLAQ